MKKLYFKLLLPFVLSSFVSVSLSAQVEFSKHSIASPTAPLDVFTEDVNGDGFIDILTVSRGSGGNVVWWKNNGSQVFERKQLASGFDNPRSVRAGDIDQDGDMDIIAVAWEGNKITWWENDGAEGFSAHDVVTGWIGPHTVELCDLDQDGDIDILCCQFDNSTVMSEVAWWENDGSQNWTKHLISSRFQQSTFVYGADMDNDGDNDLIACGELNGEICWWENDGNENWTEHMIDNQIPKIHTIIPRDLDKDGDLDILAHACVSGLQAWYKNNGNGTFSKVEMEDLGGAIWMDCADFDKDGDYDLVATGMGESNLVCYLNDGKERLTRQDLPGNLTSGFALNIVDMDKDGDKDVVAIGLNSNTLAWWENTLETTSFLNAPKWLNYTDEQGLTFIANEEDGSIVRIESSGYQYCIRNSLPICTGLAYYNGYLWVASGITLLKLNSVNGETESSLRAPAQFLQGLAIDDSGLFYLSDPYSGTILKADTETGQIDELVSGLDYPASIRYDPDLGKLLVMDGEDAVTIKCVDILSGQISTEIETSIIAGGDIVGDGMGNHYISSPEENAIYAVTRNFEDSVYLYSEGHSAPTGLVYFAEDQAIGAVSPVLNSLEIIPANATGVDNSNMMAEDNIRIYPNPVEDVLHIKLPFIQEDVRCRLSDVRGRVINELRFSGASQFEIPVGDLPRGIYLLKISGLGIVDVQRIIVE